ncbi:hypothetical protein DL770_009544 [Monosporascus sp. CRB-9-2]|nr:hypothetical protein DL770_009544 [Monosporascus sp. CRB-9-2]
MESFLPQGGFQLPFQRRLSRLYNDTKKSSDFVKEPVQSADDPEIKALHRKLRIQKDRLVSWGLEWSDSDQTAEIDESLSKAGLSDLVGSIMATIKDILAEAEPLWLASKRDAPGADKVPEKAAGDRKKPLIMWDKGRFEDLVRDLTASIDTLCDLTRTRSEAARSSRAAQAGLPKSTASVEDLRAFESTRIRAPQVIDPSTLTTLDTEQADSSSTLTSPSRPQHIVFMDKQAYSELTRQPGRQTWSPLLLEYAQFDQIYSVTGIMPSMSRFERLSTGLQTDSQRSPGAWIGLPLLLGYYEDMENSRLALVYQLPPTFNPVSFEEFTHAPLNNLCTLAELLNRPDFEPRLEAKFRLAHNLANTVFDMHARGITHGNLLDTAISFCSSPNGNGSGTLNGDVDIRRPLISSFDLFPDSFTPDPSSSPALSLHRHPLDPRTTSQSPLASKYDMKTLDLYSLAMLLVSIGLWTKLDNLVPNQASPSIPESVLEQLAIQCGTPYMRAVQACWNAVDQELARPGASDGILSHVQIRASRYLEACCILDGVSGLDERLGEEPLNQPSVDEQKIKGSTSSVPNPDYKSPAVTMPKAKPPIPTEAAPSARTDVKKPREASRNEDEKKHLTKERSPKLRLYPQVPLPEEAIEQWNSMLMPQINMALKQFYRKHPESVEISLESIGESPQQVTPTVLVVCTSVNKVRAILKKRLGVLFDGTTGFALKVCRGSVLRSRKGPRRSMGGTQKSGGADEFDSGSEADIEPDEPSVINPDFQERPRNGASIGAWIGDKHLPPVSFGGLILVDDKPYGMTVHHMLDDPDNTAPPSGGPSEPSDKARRAMAHSSISIAATQAMTYLRDEDTSTESGGDDFACEFSDSGSELSVTDLTSDDEEEEDEDEYEEYGEPGDIPGIEPGCGDGYVVTQPALDDVEEGFYPSEDTMDEDHLDTYSLGEVFASSGIRRRHEDGLVHEIDWALFEFQDDRQPGDNLVPRARARGTPSGSPIGDLHPTAVAPATSLPGMEVQCSARTSGLQTGRILPALTSVKIYGRASPSHTYQVSGSASISAAVTPSSGANTLQPQGTAPPGGSSTKSLPLGIPGDSGAWVIDRRNGRLAGHVLAWSERKQVAYICPMDVLLRDIAETLEATEVRLPGGEALISLRGMGRRGGAEDTGDIYAEGFSELESLVGDDDDEVEEEEGVPQLKRSMGGRPAGWRKPLPPSATTSATMGRDERYDDDARVLAADMEKVHLPGTEIGVGSR